MSTTDRHYNLHLTSMSNFYAKCWQTFNNNNGNSIAFLPPLWTPSVGIKAYLMPAPSFFGKTTAISTNTNCCHISDAKQSSRRTLTNHFVPSSCVQHLLAPHKKVCWNSFGYWMCVCVSLCFSTPLCLCVCKSHYCVRVFRHFCCAPAPAEPTKCSLQGGFCMKIQKVLLQTSVFAQICTGTHKYDVKEVITLAWGPPHYIAAR